MNNSKKKLFIVAGIFAIFNFLLGLGVALASALSSDFIAAIFEDMFLTEQAGQTLPADVINSFRNFLIAFSLVIALANVIIIIVSFSSAFNKRKKINKPLNVFAIVLAFLFSNLATTITLAIATLQTENVNHATQSATPQHKEEINKEQLAQDMQKIREMLASGAITQEEYKTMVLKRFNEFM